MQIYQMDKKHITDIKFPAFIVKGDNETGQWILREGIPEIKLINSCIKYLGKDKVFIDVGAHMGTYSIILSKYCKWVYAYEAQQDTYYQLCGGIALNKCKNIDAKNLGIQDKESWWNTYYITSEDGGGTSFIKPEVYLRTGTVNMDRLASFKYCGKIGLIKIDVEGYELKVIKGAISHIITDYPVILFESNHDDDLRKQIVKYLEGYDYNVQQSNLQPNMFIATYNK